MRTVLLKWVAVVGIVITLGANPGATLHAQDAEIITDQEACQKMKTLLPRVDRYWGMGLSKTYRNMPSINFAQLTPTGFILILDGKPSKVTEFAYAEVLNVREINNSTFEFQTHGLTHQLVADSEVREGLIPALNQLAEAAHAGHPYDCLAGTIYRTPAEAAKDLADFQQKTAAWRAINPKPAAADEVTKKRLLAEDAVERKDLVVARDYYRAGTIIDSTWAPGWYNAALISAELKYYSAAALYMKHYLILLPDAPDAAAAKENVLFWEAKSEEGHK